MEKNIYFRLFIQIFIPMYNNFTCIWQKRNKYCNDFNLNIER